MGKETGRHNGVIALETHVVDTYLAIRIDRVHGRDAGQR
jgi:hypothetical protein